MHRNRSDIGWRQKKESMGWVTATLSIFFRIRWHRPCETNAKCIRCTVKLISIFSISDLLDKWSAIAWCDDLKYSFSIFVRNAFIPRTLNSLIIVVCGWQFVIYLPTSDVEICNFLINCCLSLCAQQNYKAGRYFERTNGFERKRERVVRWNCSSFSFFLSVGQRLWL